MVELFADGARGPLLTAIGPADLTLSLGAGSEALFPTPGADDFFWLTLEHGPAEEPLGREIVRCSARAGNVLTISRGEQGTAALSFPATSTRVELRLTAATMESFRSALGFDRSAPGMGFSSEGAGSAFSYGPVMNSTATGATFPTPSSTKWGLLQPRITYSSTGNAQIIGSTATPASTALGIRGELPNYGGFEFLGRIVLDTDGGSARKIFGLSNSTASDRLNGVNPSQLINDPMVVIGQDLSSPIGGNWQLYCCDGGGVSVTQIDTGIPKVIGNLLQLRIFSLPGRPTFFVELTDLDAQLRYFAELTTNIPGAGVVLHATLTSRSNGAIVDGLSIVGMWTFPW